MLSDKFIQTDFPTVGETQIYLLQLKLSESMFSNCHFIIATLMQIAYKLFWHRFGSFDQVWCDVGYPRLVQRPLEIALTGKMSKRCACFEDSQLDQPGLEVYEGCDYHATRCKV